MGDRTVQQSFSPLVFKGAELLGRDRRSTYLRQAN